MSTIDDAVKQWEGLWAQGCRVYKKRRRGGAREALELILAALLYQRWALAGFADNVFHFTIRDNPTMTMADLASGMVDPLTTDRHHVEAGMHLASASIRLPVALHQVARTFQGKVKFEGLCGGNDWRRKRACRYLDEIRRLDTAPETSRFPSQLWWFCSFATSAATARRVTARSTGDASERPQRAAYTAAESLRPSRCSLGGPSARWPNP